MYELGCDSLARPNLDGAGCEAGFVRYHAPGCGVFQTRISPASHILDKIKRGPGDGSIHHWDIQ